MFFEISFDLIYFYKKKKVYKKIPNNIVSEFWDQPHPYMPFVYKKNSFIKEQPYNGLLHPDKKISFYGVKTNSLRLTDGIHGSRENKIPKPEKNFRICCLGASTTANYIKYNNAHYSYPIELEKELNKEKNNRIFEVINCGHSGWNSADLMVNFFLHVYDLSPDLIIIYHAYNDLPISLTKNFSSDYSHAKKNLAEAFRDFQIFSKIPDLKFNFLNYLNRKICGIDKISDLSLATRIQEPNFDGEFSGLRTYERNLEHIIKNCKISGIDVLLSTYIFYHIPSKEIDSITLKFKLGIDQENQIVRDLSNKYQTLFCDNASVFPINKLNFVDSVHFSHLGMSILAKNLASTIISHYEFGKY